MTTTVQRAPPTASPALTPPSSPRLSAKGTWQAVAMGTAWLLKQVVATTVSGAGGGGGWEAKDWVTLVAAIVAAIAAVTNVFWTARQARITERQKWLREQRMKVYGEFAGGLKQQYAQKLEPDIDVITANFVLQGMIGLLGTGVVQDHANNVAVALTDLWESPNDLDLITAFSRAESSYYAACREALGIK